MTAVRRRREYKAVQDVSIRPHVEPDGWQPNAAYAAPTPDEAVLIVVRTLPEPGEPPWFMILARHTRQTGDLGEITAFAGDSLPKQHAEMLNEACQQVGLELRPMDHAREYLHRIVFKRRAAEVAWRLPAARALLAVDWRIARGGHARGGYSFVTHTWPGEPSPRHSELANGEIENPFRPRWRARSLDSVRSQASETSARSNDPSDIGGHRAHVSLNSLVEAVTGTTLHTLEEAAAVLGIDVDKDERSPVDSALNEMRTLAAVYERALDLHDTVRPQAPPTPAISVGSYGRSLLERTGAQPRLTLQPDFPRSVLAAGMGSYFGGESFAPLRTIDAPVVMLDFTSAYLSVAVLASSWELIRARSVRVYERDPTEIARYLQNLAQRIHRWLKSPDKKQPLHPGDWQRLARTIVWIHPDTNVLPHRVATSSGSRRLKISSYQAPSPRPFMLADALRSLLEDGSVPTITRAIRLSPWGRQALQPVSLPSGRQIDPNTEDLIYELAVDRLRLELNSGDLPAWKARQQRGLSKGIGVALVGGLPVQYLDDEPTSSKRETNVWDPATGEHFRDRVRVIEKPGDWYFPPLAAATTANARLLLRLTRLFVEAAGGYVVYWDTDSVHVLADACAGHHRPARGEPAYPVLSYRQVEQIRSWIERLSPYPPELRPYLNTWDDDGRPVRVQLPGFLKREAVNDLPGTASNGGLPATGLRLDVNAPKRYRPYYEQRPGPHVEIHHGKPLVVEPSPAELKALSTVHVVEPSRHGITYNTPRNAPENWIEELFAAQIARDLGLDIETPEWAQDPAVTLVPANRPATLKQLRLPELRPFSTIAFWDDILKGRSYAAWFDGASADRAGWFDLETNEPLDDGSSGIARIGLTIGEAIARIRSSTDPTTTDLRGRRLARRSRGAVGPGDTIERAMQLTGRESRGWRDDRPMLSAASPVDYEPSVSSVEVEAVRNEYRGRGAAVRLHRASGVPLRTVRDFLSGVPPSKTTWTKLRSTATRRC